VVLENIAMLIFPTGYKLLFSLILNKLHVGGNVKDQLGQLIIMGLAGTTLTDEEREFIRNVQPAGINYFAQNYEDPAQLAELSNDIQSLKRDDPFFIAVDHEGGRVQRFKTHFTHFPSMLSLGNLNSPKTVFEAHKIMAEELKWVGVNMNYSPCCDIFNNPKNQVIGDRAFGTDVTQVEKNISGAIRGLQTNGIMACAKHFPGHGNTTKDSHVELPTVNKKLSEIEAEELIPFEKAARGKVEFMMMGHLFIRDLDDEHFTTVSEKAYEYLREKTKFRGIILSDDMEMGAITKRYGFGEGAVRTLKAGCDIVIYRSFDRAKEAYEAIIKAFESGELTEEMIAPKLERIKACKNRHLAKYKPVYIPEMGGKIGAESSTTFLEEIKSKLS